MSGGSPYTRPISARSIISTPAIEEKNPIVAVTSFGMTYNCNAGGSYCIDQLDDLESLLDPAGAYACCALCAASAGVRRSGSGS